MTRLLTLLLGLAIGFTIVRKATQAPQVNAERLALGRSTESYVAIRKDSPINVVPSEITLQQLVDGWQDRGRRKVLLLMGNSQLDSINQYDSERDKHTPEILYDAYEDDKRELLAINLPNGTLSEFLICYEYLCPRISVDKVIIEACYDDTREPPARPELRKLVTDSQALRASLSSSSAGRELVDYATLGVSEAATANTAQDVRTRVENWFTATLAANSPTWANRTAARVALYTYSYRLRNRLFGISAQTIRPKIPGRYNLHLAALNDLLQRCEKNSQSCSLYIAPLRSDVTAPYSPTDYETYKSDVRALAVKHHSNFLDLEHIVPPKNWGSKSSTVGEGLEVDFMHFQGAGHIILSDYLLKSINATNVSNEHK